jgi:hypothetical protein
LCDLQEASSLKDPFTAHMLAPERAEAVEVDTQLDQELLADHPSHERIEKLIALKVSYDLQLLGRPHAVCLGGSQLACCCCLAVLTGQPAVCLHAADCTKSASMQQLQFFKWNGTAVNAFISA